MIKSVIFDIDGTIVDAYDSIFEALKRTLKDLNYNPTTYEAAKRAVGKGVEFLLGEFVKVHDVPLALELYTKHTDVVLKDTVKFLPGAEKLIKDLHAQGYKLAIASNRPHQFSKKILECLKVSEYFHAIVCADDVKRAKPEPDMLIEIIERFEIECENALFVGDMTIDIETGRNAGIVTVAVPTGSSTRDEIKAARPFALIEHLSEVENILKEFAAA